LKHVGKPWGSFDQYSLNQRATVKVLTVKPGARTSLQSHKHRRELWVALDEGLLAEVQSKRVRLVKGSSIIIKKNAKHRICCDGPQEARILEVSFGDFSESDIVRYEDNYGRANQKSFRR
jgi:mannose-6-phosphate isomerase-like protein (cupin superfamily)